MSFNHDQMMRFIEADSFLKKMWERKSKKADGIEYAHKLFNTYVNNCTYMEQQYSRYHKQ